jgi:hypothetical protein
LICIIYKASLYILRKHDSFPSKVLVCEAAGSIAGFNVAIYYTFKISMEISET